jgi:hypothetical protein
MLAKVGKSLLLVLLCTVLSVPSFAGSALVGSVAGSANATVAGQPLLPNTAILSGDSLQVKDGAAVVALQNGGRLAFGRNTSASFLTDSHAVTVLMTEGAVALYQPDNKTGLEIKADDVSVKPASPFKTVGEVAMVNGTIVVNAKQGSLTVQGRGRTITLAQGKSITLAPQTKTARSPQAGGAQKLGGGNEYLEAGALVAGGVGAVLSGIALSRAGDARDNAAAANSNAAAANSNAAAANSNAAAAASDAVAAGQAANAAGCALNVIEFPASPYTPPAGFSCP